jgi:hypothetical protein
VKDIALPTLFAIALPTVIVLLVLFLSGCAPVPGGSCVDWASETAPRGIDFKVAVEMCREELRAGRSPCLRRTAWGCSEIVEEGIDFAIAPVEAP